MRKPAKRHIKGALSLATSTVLLIVGIRYQDWLKQSPTALVVLFAAIVVMVVLGLILLFSNDGVGSTQPPVGRVVQSGGDSSGPQIIAGRDVYFGSPKTPDLEPPNPASTSRLVIESANYMATTGEGTHYDVAGCIRRMIKADRLNLEIENHNFVTDDGHNWVPKDPKPGKPKRLQVTYSYDGSAPVTVERKEGTRIELPEKAVASRPDISICEFNSANVIRGDDEVFRFDENGDRPLSILIRNNRAPAGQLAAPAVSLVAHLIFRHGTRESVVDRACWIGNLENRINLDAARTSHVLVGFLRGEYWRSFHNPNHVPMLNHFDARVAGHTLEESEILFSDQMDCELSIISLKTGETMAQREFVMTRSGDGYLVRWTE